MTNEHLLLDVTCDWYHPLPNSDRWSIYGAAVCHFMIIAYRMILFVGLHMFSQQKSFAHKRIVFCQVRRPLRNRHFCQRTLF